jgi:hypothetical protein
MVAERGVDMLGEVCGRANAAPRALTLRARRAWVPIVAEIADIALPAQECGPQQHVPTTAEKARVSQDVHLAFSPRPVCRGDRFRPYVLPLLIAMATRDVDYI